jgi:hypothetical protein
VQEICVSDIDEGLLSSIGARLVVLPDDSLFVRHIQQIYGSKRFSEYDRGALPGIFDDCRRHKFDLLYRGSRDGFKMSDIHRLCDGHCHTLIVIESTKGNVFGGYTPLAWQSSGGYQRDASLTSFLFSLKNPRDSIMRRFPVKGVGSNAIYCHSGFLAFGDGHDLYVCDNCNSTNNNYTNIRSTFENNTGIDGKLVLDGAYNFTVHEIEILRVVD